jgi:hypothetical protein
MGRKRKRKSNMSADFKQQLKDSDKGSYYNQPPEWFESDYTETQPAEDSSTSTETQSSSSMAASASFSKIRGNIIYENPSDYAETHSDIDANDNDNNESDSENNSGESDSENNSGESDSENNSDESGDDCQDNTCSSISGNILIDSTVLQTSVNDAAVCSVCREGELQFLKRNRRGWSVEVGWLCNNKQCAKSSTDAINWNYSSLPSGRACHAINRALVFGMRTIGRGYSAAQMLSSILNLPKPPSPSNWANHTKVWCQATGNVLSSIFQEAALKVKTLRAKMGQNNDLQMSSVDQIRSTVMDIPVSIDGSWKSRNQSSHGITAAIAVDTGEVLDAHYSCSTCRECTKHENLDQNSLEYLAWFVEHSESCHKNHTGSSQSMEASGATELFSRSVDNYGIRYNPFIGDGDAKSFKDIVKLAPYGPDYNHRKEECIGHVQKRMGTRLRKELERSKGI